MAKVTGSKVNRGGGCGLEIPCKYTFYGPKDYIDKPKAVCSKLNSDRWAALNIVHVRFIITV